MTFVRKVNPDIWKVYERVVQLASFNAFSQQPALSNMQAVRLAKPLSATISVSRGSFFLTIRARARALIRTTIPSRPCPPVEGMRSRDRVVPTRKELPNPLTLSLRDKPKDWQKS